MNSKEIRPAIYFSNSNNEKILSLAPYLIQKDPYRAAFSKTEEPLLFRAIKRRVFIYRIAFIALGTLFITLTALLFIKVPNWNFNLLFKNGLTFKMLISSIAASFGLASLWIGCSLRAAIETLNTLARDSKRALKKAYLSMPKNKLIKKRYLTALQEIEAFAAKAAAQLDSIEENRFLKETKKKSLALDLIAAHQRNLDKIVADFSS